MTLKALLLVSATSLGSPAFAQGVPTVDTTNIAKMIEMISEAKLQLKEAIAANLKLDDQILKMAEQITLLQGQLTALKDGLSLAALGLDPETFLADILPDFSDLTSAFTAAKSGNWSEVLASGSVGSQSTEGFVDEFFASVGLDRATVDTLSASDTPATARIGTRANTAAFLSVSAEASAEDATESLERLEELAGMIPDTEGLKQAVDLNTRVTAELAVALTQIWSMEAVQVVNMGEMGVMDAATAAEEENFLKVEGD